MDRPTIRDIARKAGVSAGAASFALNGRPGVSEATRERVLQVAAELGWTPSVAALALSGQRARAVGLVIARPADSIASEGFFLRLVAGVESILTNASLSLVLQLVDTREQELAIYRRWWSERRVDGVILTDPSADDPRPALLEQLGLATVIVGGDGVTHGASAVAVSESGAMQRVMDHLVEVGHERVAHVSGLSDLVHTQRRHAAFCAAAERAHVAVVPAPATDFTEAAGLAATRELLFTTRGQLRRRHPTAIIYDNELLALGGLSAIHAGRLRVPHDVAIVSWEDSPVCRVVQPPLTALQREPAELGRHAAELLLELLEGESPRVTAEVLPPLVVRGSTAA